MPEKFEFLKGDETVYSSSLDVFGGKEHQAWGACIPKVAELLGECGWETRLNELSKDKIKQLILIITLEFEKWMKLEQLPEGEAPLFFNTKVKIDLPKDTPEKGGFTGGLIPPDMETPTRPNTGPVTDADFPWETDGEQF
jgi:hypothetical protein